MPQRAMVVDHLASSCRDRCVHEPGSGPNVGASGAFGVNSPVFSTLMRWSAGTTQVVVDFSTVLPYVKPALGPSAPDGNLVELHDDGAPATRPFVGSLLTTYVVDDGGWFRYITDVDMRAVGHSVDQLHGHAVENAARLVTGRLDMPRCGAITPVLYDGNLEVSVMFLDEVWEWFAAEFGGAEIVAVAPCRDILGFCPTSSADGRPELEELIERVWCSADHPLTKDFYWRAGGTWVLDSGFTA